MVCPETIPHAAAALKASVRLLIIFSIIVFIDPIVVLSACSEQRPTS
jgi:hypothetical protein